MYLVKNSFKEFEINGKQAFKHIYLLESEENTETNFINEIQNGLAILKITYVYE